MNTTTNALEESVEDSPHSLTVLCGREFWNVTSAWESDLPDVGLCLERTVLIWIPCIFLWALSPLHISLLRRRGHLYMPWTKLFVAKTAVSVLLIAAGVTELVWAFKLSSQGMALPVNEYLAPMILLLTYSLHLLLVAMGHRHGERNSPLIYVFWLLMVLCGAPQVFTTIQYTIDQDDRLHLLMAVTFLIEYSGAVVLFVANCFADQRPGFTNFSKNKNPMPSKSASFISKVTFHWVNNVIWKGWRSTLSADDIWDLPSMLSSVLLDRKWDEAWEREAKKQRRNTSSKVDSETCVKVSVLRVLLRRFGLHLILVSLLYFFSESLVFASPRILRVLIQFTTSLDEPAWHGYFYALLLLSVMLLNTLIKNIFFFLTQMITIRIRSSVMTAVYRKALMLSNTSRRESTLGEIVNLMAIDSQCLSDAVLYLNLSLVSPLIVAIAIGELWQILGPSALAGLIVLILLIPTNSILANKIKILQVSQMKHKDSRIKLITEIINGIKVLKLYAWEVSFAAQVDSIRNSEIKVMKKIAFIQALLSFVFSTTPYFVTLVSFTTFMMVSEENTLDVQNTFVAIALINILNVPLTILPNTVAHCIQANVSMKRLGKYFNLANIDIDSIKEDREEDSTVAVYGGHFSWGDLTNEEHWKLKDIDITVADKSLVAVVGSVGAGKSSIVSALLGEMQKENGKVIVNGKIAYVSQLAWLQNASLKENILWGEDFDVSKYQRVIEACALQPDLDMLPGGDETEVGEKGLNLSGGQKQRISLARAVYSNPDILILDDPLSAVDAHVGRHIFEKLIGPEGLTKSNTRILVTHAIWVLPQVDEIFVVEDGRVVERGTYNKLLSEGGKFAQFLLQHITSSAEDEEDELEELYNQLEDTPVGQALLRQVSLCSSGSDLRRTNSTRRSRTISTESQFQSEHTHSVCKSTSTLDAKKEEGTSEEMTHILVKEENMEKGKVKLQVYHFYATSMGYLRALLPIFFFVFAQGSKAGSNIWLSEYSTPVGMTGNVTVEEFDRFEFLIGYGGFGLGQCFFFFMGALTTWTGTLKAAKHIHHGLLHNILHLPMSFFDTNPSGRVMNRMSKDMDALDSVLPLVINTFFTTFAQVLMTMIVIISSTPVVAIVIVPVLGVYYLVQKIYITSARQIKRIESLAKSPIFSFFSESLQGVSTIRAFKKQGNFVSVCRERVDDAAKAYVTNIATNRWLLVRLETLGNLITFATAIFAVAGRGSIEPGIVGLSITYALEVTFIMNSMVRNASEVEANIVSAERIQEYIKEEQEAHWTTDTSKKSPANSWPDRGCIKFNKYQSRYRPGLELVLKGITCEVKAGEKVGIVGRTGAGKSSLTLGLFRIVEAAGGSIEIDRVNIAEIGLHDLRGKLTIIPQDPVIFSGTLRMNLDPFSEHSDTDVWKAIQNAHLEDYVKAQASALDTTIDEGGSNLSIGQRQLVCLARALLRKSRILVLDEATAAVDLDTDNLIQETIRREFADCTILTIAHRLNNIMDSDRVMVLDKGFIAEFSSPSELLSNKHSIFYALAEDAGLT